MSGIYGIVGRTNITDAPRILTRMAEAIPVKGAVAQQHSNTTAAAHIAILQPPRIGASGGGIAERPSGTFCIYEGVIYRESGSVNHTLVEQHGAEVLLTHYLASGVEGFTRVRGSFNAALWDADKGVFILANDKLGHRPLFWGYRNGTLVFASLLARVMASRILATTIDVEAFADLLSYEYILGERTLFQDVRILPPGSYLTLKDGNLQIRTYWRLDQVEVHGGYDARRQEELQHAFTSAVQRAVRPDITCSVGLTGGLDSRCVLAAAASQQLSFISHTGGQENSTDVVLSRQLAERVGATHRFEQLSPEHTGAWLTPMVLHQGGIIATLHSHPCQYLYEAPHCDAEVLGIGGEFVRSFWLSAKDPAITSQADAQQFLRNRLMGRERRQQLEQLWRPEFRTTGTRAPQEHLDSLLAAYTPQDTPAVALDYFYLHERCRKFLNKAVLISRAYEEVYFPFLDHQWIEAVAAVPLSERLANKIQVELIKNLYPSLLDIPYTKTLISFSASPLQTWMINRYRAVQRKASRKLGFVKGPPAVVPNHDYPRWSRQQMRNTLVELLYHPEAAYRAYLSWDAVEPMLNRHFSGAENKSGLVSALAVFEIAHKQWVTA